ncbi:hypothetical protein Hypma_003037 [Hypsizygus marmoreus]|uniref:Uncharacterized protein n=1 Tax=Hypsizygus marmoreus TaxID=39966 RepID=A0A369JBS3_HYPMA|nr:hypothetical protein Hypma_003037 [Hypsizygus marmoreus]
MATQEDLEAAQSSSLRRPFVHRPGCPSADFKWNVQSTDSFFDGPAPSIAARENCYGCRVADFLRGDTQPHCLPGEEPATLSMRLFKLGFLFPPLWILGALAPFLLSRRMRGYSPPSPGAEKIDEMNAAENGKVEIKWARRCLKAVAAFLCVGAGTAVLSWWILKD